MSKDTARPQPLSQELLAAAGALRGLRARLVRLLADGAWPEGAFPDIATVQLLGLDVAKALERLADLPQPQHTPTHLDERR
jgi:hypothetical protein